MTDEIPIGRAENLSGRKFGRLTPLYRVPNETTPKKAAIITWKCRCDCGIEKAIGAAALKSSNTKSCGCQKTESSTALLTTHGKTGSGVHNSWSNMRKRCLDSNYRFYRNYGGLGIRICDRWMKFENFLEDMGDRPAGKSIERRENNGNYEPGNCFWATMRQQCVNKRNSRFIEVEGERLHINEWSKRCGIGVGTLRSRMQKGWSQKDAVTLPLGSARTK